MSRCASILACAAVGLIAGTGAPSRAESDAPSAGDGARPFSVEAVDRFDHPWAMAFLPDGALLVTEMRGALHLRLADGTRREVQGVPEVDFGGQGGLGDVALHPRFGENRRVYLSYAEAGEGDTRGAAVARARLERSDDGGGRLVDLEVIWRQVPKVTGRGHFGHRLRFGPDGHLWITSGDRQKLDPAQDLAASLGKILRLADDGGVPEDNPFASRGGVAAQVWSLGHRNPLGIAFGPDGALWAHEMGPRGGDELNRIERGRNYGWPLVSNGDHYDGRSIPDHDTRPDLEAPVITWTPVISPAGFVIYDGDALGTWRGSGLIGGLSSRALVRVVFEEGDAREVERFDMGERIREVEQGPDGAVWLLEDGRRGGAGRLLRLTARRGGATPE